MMKIKTNKTFTKKPRIKIKKKRIKVEMPTTIKVKMQFLGEK